MSKTVIRSGTEAVELRTDKSEVVVRYGPDGTNATIYLDWGEARELAEAILDGFTENLQQGRHEA